MERKIVQKNQTFIIKTAKSFVKMTVKNEKNLVQKYKLWK